MMLVPFRVDIILQVYLDLVIHLCININAAQTRDDSHHPKSQAGEGDQAINLSHVSIQQQDHTINKTQGVWWHSPDSRHDGLLLRTSNSGDNLCRERRGKSSRTQKLQELRDLVRGDASLFSRRGHQDGRLFRNLVLIDCQVNGLGNLF